MNYMRQSRLLLGLILLVGLALIAINIPVSAESLGNVDKGLEISPAYYELNAEAGRTYSLDLKLKNVTPSDVIYNSSVNDFVSANETGAPSIVEKSTLPATASIISWIPALDKIKVKSQQRVAISAQINVPANAEPGGHYGVLSFYGDAPSLNSTGVGINVSTGVLILIRVSGDITEKASLASFYTSLNDKQSWFFENSPITFVTRIRNEGNIHVKPIGNIEIHDMFGNLVESLEVGDVKSNVLPDGIRRYDVQYDNGWMFGKYTANLALGYGTTGQAITATTDFWVIPYKLIIAAIFIIATVIYILSRLIKVYNRRIIEKAKNENSNKNKKHDTKKDK